jgi:pSer/pThr/pTyr-binding forkhead associated (FHA) protein
VPQSLLNILKFAFLGVLYLFFLRVLRAVWVELREPKTPPPLPVAPAPAPGGRTTTRARAAKTKQAHLVLVEPANRKGQTFDLGEELTVGRAAGCGVALPEDTFVSQLHARIFRRNGGLFVEDLGSTNGTYLNRKPVSAAVPIRKGDRLQIGKTVLEVNR